MFRLHKNRAIPAAGPVAAGERLPGASMARLGRWHGSKTLRTVAGRQDGDTVWKTWGGIEERGDSLRSFTGNLTQIKELLFPYMHIRMSGRCSFAMIVCK